MSPDSYFDERSKQLASIGLDPDDDDAWAMPDYELEEILEGELVFTYDGWLFGARPYEYDSYAKAWCRNCYEIPAANDDLLCTFCRFDHDRKAT